MRADRRFAPRLSPRALRALAPALLLGFAVLVGALTLRGRRPLHPWASGHPELYFRSQSGVPVELDALPKR